MPLISISTSSSIPDKKEFLENSSKLISELTNKPENYVMVKLIENLPMYFAQSDNSCCFVEVKSIGSLNPSLMAKSISEFISSALGINDDRIYIHFEDVAANKWAWKSSTFG